MVDQYGTPIPPVEEPKKSNTTLIIIVVVLLVLCCCCVVVAGAIWALWTYGDQLLGITSLIPYLLT